MNLFKKLPDNFFSLLASKNKNVYGMALLVLYDALSMYRDKIRRSDYVSLLKNRLSEEMSDFVEEDENPFEDKASLIVRRLIETGWIYIDYDPAFMTEFILLPSYSVNMLKVINEFASSSQSNYVSYVHTTYADLKIEDDSQDESMYKVLENAYHNTQLLAVEVIKLDHSLRVYKHQLGSLYNPNEVLRQHFDISREDVIDPIYHPLKTHDSITLYQGPISAILKKWLEVDSVREKLIEQCLKENRDVKNRSQATSLIVKMITEIQDTYFKLANEINKIDVVQSEYVKASSDKVIFLNNQDRSVKGKLEKIIAVLARNINGPEETRKDFNIVKSFASSIKLYTQGYYDSDSLRFPYSRTEKIISEPLSLSDDDYEFNEDAFLSSLEENKKFSDDNIMAFMASQFKGNDSVEVKDMEINSMDDFLYLILGTVKFDYASSFYTLEREDKLDVNIQLNSKVNAPNYTYRKKEK